MASFIVGCDWSAEFSFDQPGEENSDSPTPDSGPRWFSSWSWSSGPAPDPLRGAPGFMGGSPQPVHMGLRIWRRDLTVSVAALCGRSFRTLGLEVLQNQTPPGPGGLWQVWPQPGTRRGLVLEQAGCFTPVGTSKPSQQSLCWCHHPSK